MHPVDKAIQAINRDVYVLREDGSCVTQSSSKEIIASILRFSDIRPGQRVLEIGTGSGYSTALLANLVGPSGKVVSIDIDPELTQRASRLFRNQGLDQINAVTKDGREGFQKASPFDRIIAWATVEYLPKPWKDQLGEDGLIVVPVQLLPLANTTAVVRLRKKNGSLTGEKIRSGSFIKLTDAPVYDFFGAETDADIVEKANDEVIAWASAEWMKTKEKNRKKQWLAMFKRAKTNYSFLKPEENFNDLKAFLMAVNPPGLTTAERKDVKGRRLIGFSDPYGLAFLSVGGDALTAGSSNVSQTLSRWIINWRHRGKPGYESLKPVIRKVESHWIIRATLTDMSSR